MKMTDITSGQTMLWMGDLLKAGCETFAAKYDGYLKSDLLQVAHHGKSEALPVYQKVLPTVAFWSCTTSQRTSLTNSGRYSTTNKFLGNNVPTHVCSNSTYTIRIPYTVGDKMDEWDRLS